MWLGLSLWAVLLATTILTALYELVEMALGIIEDWQNAFLDVIIAVAGAWAAYVYLDTVATSTQIIVFVATGALSLVLLYAGWRRYLRRRIR